MRDTYGDKVRIVFRNMPLGMHARALPAAEAAMCARDQGKFWEYHDKILQNQRALEDADLKRYATELSLDAEAFNSCLDSGKFKNEIMQEMRDGQQVGVTGTPAFFVNGRFLSGAQPFEAFKVIIDQELKD
ncbi:MAG: thioredoxin domain-containing protein [Phycisphaerales bacterium]|nr:MAG: thioredoxin domain-containing protein [Phycisphaerales bacterium]